MKRNVSGMRPAWCCIDHRLVDRDVEPALPDPGIDDAESPGHGVSALHDGDLELAADLPQVLLFGWNG